MTESRLLLQHFPAAIAYRTQKALRDALPTWAAEVERFHATLRALRDDFADPTLTAQISDAPFLHGPLSDAWWRPDRPPLPPGPDPLALA